MDTEHFRRVLLNKEQELLSEITRLEDDAREARVADVGDPIDEVTSSQGKETAYEESTAEARTLRLVRDALQRIQEGTYGRCVDCGREIGEARLEAVPWTLYCKEDQEKHDREERPDARAAF
jgi:DnaK suppressor protein